ncbi:Hsp90 cochaperone [Coemansia sp. RSA 2603]|nr:Hsp90 cochaperone [Coemansia sp. RSA 2603]
MTLIELKKWTQALKHAEQCIALEPQWVKGYYLKGLILSNESKIEQALVALKKAIEIEPNNTRIKALLKEVEGRVEYVESRLQRRKNGGTKSQTKEATAGGGTVDEKADAKENEEPVEDVDSDEDYCNEDGCRTPKKIKLKVTRKQIMDTALEVGVAVVGVVVVCWFINKYN